MAKAGRVIVQGDCLTVLKRMRAETVHTCITSPPYWGLRDYGSPNQIGLEQTPELYVEQLKTVFAEVRRVLRRDGTLWLNLGDCYATGAGAVGEHPGGAQGARWRGDIDRIRDDKRGYRGERLINTNSGTTARVKTTGFRGVHRPETSGKHARQIAAMGPMTQPNRMPIVGLKSKDLVGIPWRVAFALQAAGWYLRSDIIWHKPNPMPESVTDRPTKAHEYLFLLTKSESYYYDAHAIREGLASNSHPSGNKARQQRSQRGGPHGDRRHQAHAVPWTPTTAGRNRRSVWTIPTAPFPGAHFATFPARLVEPCILAGSSEHGCCSVCGAPFSRIIERGAPAVDQQRLAGADATGGYHGKTTKAYNGTGAQDPAATKARILAGMRERLTVGWNATCRHTLRDVVPCTVLDPFAGAGTTGLVAERLGRAFVGIELNPEYIAIAERRLAQVSA